MVIQVLSETAEIMLKNKYPKEIWITKLHRDVPWQRHRHGQHDARNPQRGENRLPIALHRDKDQQDDARKKDCDRPLGERRQCEKEVENNESNSFSRFIPRIP